MVVLFHLVYYGFLDGFFTFTMRAMPQTANDGFQNIETRFLVQDLHFFSETSVSVGIVIQCV